MWKLGGDYFEDDVPIVKTDQGQHIVQTSYGGLSYAVRETMVADAEFIAHAKEDIACLLEQLEITLQK